ncbi:formate dehydrogenase [Mycobacterium paraseoulense]|nr:formate dehydrogenase [Mycobacterium paraseoulense]
MADMATESETTIVRSTFCRICESRCGIDVQVQGGRITRIGPDKANPYSWQDFCSKGRSAAEVVYHPRRLKWPMRRVDGGYRRASWAEATEDIARRLNAIRDRFGPDSIAAYLGNPVGFNGANVAWFASFVRALGTNNMFSVSSVDQNNLERVCYEMYGRWLIPLVPDVDECDYFLLVGMNPAVSTFGWIHNVPNGWRRVLTRQADGATVVIVDPNRTQSAEQASRHISVWPGQDWALLLAMLAVIVRNRLARFPDQPAVTGLGELDRLAREVDLTDLAMRCRVPADVIESTARGFASARTAMCVAHTGVAHNGEGVLAEWLSHVLNAITGRLDTVGGRRFEPGYTSIKDSFGTSPPKPSRVRSLPAVAGARSLAELADEILTPGDGQIKALICNSGNPVISGPHGNRLEGALAQLDLLVAIDLVQRESHAHADWLLPAAHFLERDDFLPIYSSFEDQPFAQLAQAVVQPPDDAREEWMFFRDLALALELPMFGPATASMTPRAMWKKLVDDGGKLSWSDVEGSPHGVVYGDKEYGRLAEAVATSDGAVHLAPEPFLQRVRAVLDAAPASPSPDWPLLLSNQRWKSAMNSWLNDTPTALKRQSANTVYLNTDDAAPLGISSGDVVRVSSRTATLECTAEVSSAPRQGVVILGHGWGSRVFDPHGAEPPAAYGVNRNALVADADVDPLSGTPAFGIVEVRVAKV